ncbi:thermonuclease family protein [Nitratireductor pacificus]|uniref:Nuclease n=1 Tax=Nitratireductor pacificus pht-3B TaxID=391937 RepID=K2LJH6_9HYPH|nr:thermonuclease family protein [Nitratireductor pacificus]EKF17904.1 nuclease [Nitratireductor pacificus pht-3B]
MSRSRFRKRRRSRFGRFGDLLLALGLLVAVALAVERLDRFSMRSLSGAVTVHDGDTITVSGERIRLKGLDAPEYAQTCSRQGATYACGRQARDMLRQLVGTGPVDCEGFERDRYDRLLAVCTAGGRDVGEALVEAGWAVAYGDYDRVEADARRARRGLWDGAFDAPRDWRELHGQEAGMEATGIAGRVANIVRRLLARISGYLFGSDL